MVSITTSLLNTTPPKCNQQEYVEYIQAELSSVEGARNNWQTGAYVHDP